MNEIRPSQQPPATTPPRFDDEIDLVDVALALWRRRFLVLGFLFAGVVLGAALSLVPRADHGVRAVLTVGKITNGGAERLVESTETISDWLNNSLLPAAVQRVADDAGVDPSRFNLSAKNGNGNGLVIEGKPDGSLVAEHVAAIEWATAKVAEIADQPIRDRESQLGSDIRNLELKLDRLKDVDRLESERLSLLQDVKAKEDELEALKDGQASAQHQIGRLKQMMALLEKRAAEINRYLDSRPQEAAAHGKRSAADAMTMMLIGNEVQRQMDRLASINEQLTVELPERIRTAQDSLAENERQQRQVETDIEEARLTLKTFEANHRRDVEQIELGIADKQAQLDNLQRTRLLNEPQTRQEGGPGVSLFIALGAILGLFAGLFAALMANFIAAARERLHGENHAED